MGVEHVGDVGRMENIMQENVEVQDSRKIGQRFMHPDAVLAVADTIKESVCKWEGNGQIMEIPGNGQNKNDNDVVMFGV
eukprot:14900244-Ditylum_brightwellii.AAC.2